MYTLLTLATFLPLIVFSLPTSIIKRAGAPNPQPIPANCTVTNPHPDNPGLGFQPTTSFVSNHSLYQYVTYPGENNLSEKKLETQCLETCYGYGNKGECISTFLAENVTVLEYGTQVTGTVCQLFSKHLHKEDFMAPKTPGTYQNPKVGDIYCPK